MLFGKFYHRPPGGESYCDVIMRLRSVLGTITREHAAGDRVLVVCHSVVVNCFRYLLERMTEEEIMEEDRVNEILNCSLTSYRYDPRGGRRGHGGLAREQCNDVTPLIRAGVATRHPDQHELRMLFGKFYHRPPGGESYCDVIMRLRSVLGTIAREYTAGDRVLVVCHSVVVNCFRYLLERMTEEEIMEEDRVNEILNCSVTSYRYDAAAGRRGHGALVPERINDVRPLMTAGVGVS